MKVTFIGLGIMGSRMAKNLSKNKVELTVYNRTSTAAHALKDDNITIAEHPNEAVKGADVVFTMLSTPEVVSKLAFGSQGFLTQMKEGAIWADCSTVNPSFVKQSASIAQQNGVHYLDTPVAGTKPHAENAELVFFVGGHKKQLAIIQPLLAFMGRKVIHVGEQSKGAAFKMLVNGMLAQSMLIFSETFLLGQQMGLDRTFLLNMLPNLVVAAPFTKAKAEMIKANDYSVQFPLEWMHKDLHLAALSAYENNQPSPMLNLAKEIFGKAKAAGLGREDFAAIHKYLER